MIDFLLFVFLFLLSMALGLFGLLSDYNLMAFIFGAFLTLLGSYCAVDNQMVFAYYSSTETYVQTLAWTPYPQLFMVLMGVIIMVASSVGKVD